MVLGVVVASCSGDHPTRTRTWRHSSEALEGFLRGGFGFVSVRFQDNAGLYGTAVAIKNKPAPDDPLPTRIFSEPITIIAPWPSHQPNMTWPLGNFQGWLPKRQAHDKVVCMSYKVVCMSSGVQVINHLIHCKICKQARGKAIFA